MSQLLSSLHEEAEKRFFELHQLVQSHFARKSPAGTHQLTKYQYDFDPSGGVSFKVPVKLVKHPANGKLPFKIVSAKTLDLSSQGLNTLENCPEQTDDFDCSYSSFLNSLVGGPSHAHSYYCLHTPITSLVGAPKTVVKHFSVHSNPHLTSLEGLPERMESFDISIKRNLPLLRIPLVKGLTSVGLFDKMSYEVSTKRYSTATTLEELINAHLDQGKPGVFKLHDALVDAGFEEHAKF